MNGSERFNIYAKVLFAVIGGILGFIIMRIFIVPVWINSTAMEPAFTVNDYVWFYKTDTVAIGSIALYKSPFQGYQVGRVIAQSGQTVEIINKKVYINGVPLIYTWETVHNDKRVLSARLSNRDNLGAVTIPSGHVFILSDNWDNPNDSRLFGAIPLGDIAGRHLFRISTN